MAQLKVAPLLAPAGGMNIGVGPDQLDDTEAEWIDNFLVGTPGVLRTRGPFPVHAAGAVADAADRTRQPVFLGLLVNSTQNIVTRSWGSGRNVEPWHLPYRAHSDASKLAWGYTYNMVSGTYAGIYANPPKTVSVYGNQVNMGDTTYALGYDGQGDHPTATLQSSGWTDGPIGFVRPIYVCDRISDVSGWLSGATANAPHSGQYLLSHLNRLWHFGGYAPGAAPKPYEPNTIFWSRECHLQSLSDPFNANDWKDTSGNINRIVVGNQGSGADEWLVGGAIVNQNMVIFKNNSVWTLYGDSPSNFVLKKVVADRGCIDPNSIFEADDGVYFMSQRGVEFYDGSDVRRVSGPIQPYIDQILTRAVDPDVLLRPYVTIGAIGSKYIRVALYNDTNGMSLCMNRETGGWTVFSGEGFGTNRHANYGSRWVTAAAPVYDGTWVDRESDLTRRWQQDFTASVVYRRITPPRSLEAMHLHKLSLDTKVNMVGVNAANADTAAEVVLVSARESTGDFIIGVGDWNIRGQSDTGLSTRYPTGRRSIYDNFNEAIDLQPIVFITPTASGQTVRIGEIYDGAVEWSSAYARRSTRST